MKKVHLDIENLDGNAFAIIGAFTKQARYEGWEQHEIDGVIKEMIKSDYDNLLSVLTRHTYYEGSPIESEEELAVIDDDEELEHFEE